MKNYLKPLLVLLPVIAIIFYYLVTLSNRSEFPDDNNPNKVKIIPAYENFEIDNFTDWKGRIIPGKSSPEPIIIVHFWASWCAPCIHEFPDLIKMAKILGGSVQVYALSEDNEKNEITAFVKSFKNAETTDNFHIIWDEGHKIMNKWEVSKLPESYIFGPDRKLLKHVSGVVAWSSRDTIEYFKMISKSAKAK